MLYIVDAELNFGWDPDAAAEVFERFTCKKTILPKRICIDGCVEEGNKTFLLVFTTFLYYYIKSFFNTTYIFVPSLKSLQDWRKDLLRSVNPRRYDELTEFANINILDEKCYSDGIVFHDFFLMAIFVFPKCVQQKKDYYATIELMDLTKRGRICVEHDQEKNPPNVTIVESLDKLYLKKAMSFANFPIARKRLTDQVFYDE